MNIAILLSGGGSNMVALVDAMQDGRIGAIPALVISNRADVGGLGKAQARGVPTQVVDHRPFGENRAAFEDELTAQLEAAQIDLICLAGFMRVLTPHFVDRWQGKMINIHPSILPGLEGLQTHQRVLDAGAAVHGCTVHFVTAQLDAGPIVGQAIVRVDLGDTADTLAAKVLKMEHQLYPAALAKVVTKDDQKLLLGA